MAEIQWYYARDEVQFGPVTAAELRHLSASGGLSPQDLVWRDGMEEWAPAGKLKGLFPDAKPASPEPPPSDPLPAASAVMPPMALPPEPPQPPQPAFLPAEAIAASVPEPAAPRPAAITPSPHGPERHKVLLLVQLTLWGACVLVVLLGGVALARALANAKNAIDEAAAGAIFSTFFLGAYVVARAGEKICQLIVRRGERPK